ncbi:hypothetical protein FGIG_11205 [Fasciola gigantica]|uniref:Uncharacterized protein n=1 Tax=Fasciola gigantica TaxID=46835 RepID=A0A504ZC90_FASGI|nr:hypothetical protein FGIG_11205 [Fasciola gigantica]
MGELIKVVKQTNKQNNTVTHVILGTNFRIPLGISSPIQDQRIWWRTVSKRDPISGVLVFLC